MSFVLPALSIGLGSIKIKPTRGFFPTPTQNVESEPLLAQVTIEELHRDDMEITSHPVELGAPISDHAFMRPAEVVIKCAWSNSPTLKPSLVGAALGVAGLNIPALDALGATAQTIVGVNSILNGGGENQVTAIYRKLRQLQSSRIPFTIYTGKRMYENMLFASLAVNTDKETENVLSLTAICRQVIIVTSRTIKVPINPAAQADAPATTPSENAGAKQLKTSPLGSGTFGIL